MDGKTVFFIVFFGIAAIIPFSTILTFFSFASERRVE